MSTTRIAVNKEVYGIKSLIKRIGTMKEVGSIIALAAMTSILLLTTDKFMTTGNLLNVTRQISTLAIMAVGMAFVIITGGIDLSVGSIMSCSACVLGLSIVSGLDPTIGIIGALITGTLIGLLNGVLVAYVKLPAFIVTLGTASAFRGITLLITNGWPITLKATEVSSWFFFIGAGKVFGEIPVQSIIMLVVCGVGTILLRNTVFGHHVYAVGGNEHAATLAGIRTRKVKTSVYALSGFLCGLASILTVAYARTAQPTLGDGIEQNVIAAAVIGGVLMSGGEGTILGSLLGAITIGVMLNGLTLLGASAYIQKVMIGVVIVGAVILSERIRKTKKQNRKKDSR